MAADDRKRRILEHLNRSTDGMQYIKPKKSTQSTSTPTPTPVPKPEPQPTPTPVPTPPKVSDRKRRILNHVQSSSGDFGDFSLSSDKRKKQIEDHIRKSLN